MVCDKQQETTFKYARLSSLTQNIELSNLSIYIQKLHPNHVAFDTADGSNPHSVMYNYQVLHGLSRLYSWQIKIHASKYEIHNIKMNYRFWCM